MNMKLGVWSFLKQSWRDHSLSIVLVLISLILFCIGWPFEEGKWFDVFIGFSQSFAGVAILNFLSGPLREKNKPEEF